jgi:hypothetical protein
MAIDTVTHLIQVMIVPVVMVSACALLINGILQQYTSINDRMRVMVRERLELWRPGADILDAPFPARDVFTSERLDELDTQLPQLLRRHYLVHHALVTFYGALLCFIVCMFVVAFAALLNSGPLAIVALFLFLLSTGVVLIGLVPMVREMHVSQQAIRYEVYRILSLGK